ncbi:MAG: hypothetical protein GY856_26610, partial [bacterium]|nr:hypothetical protein [bacterium]
MNQRLARATGRVAADLAERRATIGRRRGEPCLGETFLFRRAAGRGVEWAVVERRVDDGNLLLVPLDDFPFTGSRDVELPAASLGGVANVRCDVGVWLAPRAFRAERRTGMLPAEDLERVRGRRRAF